jgi:hypothetical protein
MRTPLSILQRFPSRPVAVVMSISAVSNPFSPGLLQYDFDWRNYVK